MDSCKRYVYLCPITNDTSQLALMPGNAFSTIHELALDQHGYVTTEQARKAGVDHRALAMMSRRGTLIREGWGLYRDPLVADTKWTPYMAAVLWPHGTRGILSHETALTLYELSDVNPAVYHLTVPKAYRVRRTPPAYYRLHRDDLRPDEITKIEGLPVTTVARTILDCHRTHLGPALLRQAISQAVDRGHLSRAEADHLVAEILVGPPPGGGGSASSALPLRPDAP